MGNLHLVTYAQGECSTLKYRYEETQKLLIESAAHQTSKGVYFHSHNLKSIKQKPWFKHIKDFPKIPAYKPEWEWRSRGGYWCSWKAFLTLDAFNSMDEEDVLIWCDSSRHNKVGFKHNLDNLLDYVKEHGSIFGAAGNNSPQHKSLFPDLRLWYHIWPESENIIDELFKYQHILTTWYILRKDDITKKILEEWVELFKGFELDGRPAFALSHIPEQSFWNVLLYRENVPIFFNNVSHNMAKNHNTPFLLANENPNNIQKFIFKVKSLKI